MCDFETFVLITISVLSGMALAGWMTWEHYSPSDHATVTCHPQRAVVQFADRGHKLVVCATERGLVVREVEP